MISTLSRNWWTFVVRGVFAILFGAVALALPQLTLVMLVWMFGAYIIADGFFQIISAVTRKDVNDRWGMLLLEGVIGIGLGVLAFAWPQITGIVLFTLIVIWALVTGVLEIAAAIQLRKEIDNEWLLAFSGILSILLGIGMLAWPGASILALVWVIGVYAILFGITLIVLGFRLRTWNLSGSQTPS